MIYVGIDVAKNKHDCFITNSDGEILFKPFTIPNNLEGFDNLYRKIESTTNDPSKVKVGLEATGHYNYNLLGYLIDKGLTTYVINPLHTNLHDGCDDPSGCRAWHRRPFPLPRLHARQAGL